MSSLSNDELTRELARRGLLPAARPNQLPTARIQHDTPSLPVRYPPTPSTTSLDASNVSQNPPHRFPSSPLDEHPVLNLYEPLSTHVGAPDAYGDGMGPFQFNEEMIYGQGIYASGAENGGGGRASGAGDADSQGWGSLDNGGSPNGGATGGILPRRPQAARKEANISLSFQRLRGPTGARGSPTTTPSPLGQIAFARPSPAVESGTESDAQAKTMEAQAPDKRRPNLKRKKKAQGGTASKKSKLAAAAEDSGDVEEIEDEPEDEVLAIVRKLKTSQAPTAIKSPVWVQPTMPFDAPAIDLNALLSSAESLTNVKFDLVIDAINKLQERRSVPTNSQVAGEKWWVGKRDFRSEETTKKFDFMKVRYFHDSNQADYLRWIPSNFIWEQLNAS